MHASLSPTQDIVSLLSKAGGENTPIALVLTAAHNVDESVLVLVNNILLGTDYSLLCNLDEKKMLSNMV